MPKSLSIITSCYRGEKYLPTFFQNLSEQTIFGEIEVVFVANDPTEAEKSVIWEFQKKYPENIVYLEVPREPLSVSMNRAILASNGDYIFNWDIDDLRTNNSIELQYEILSSERNIMLTYGNFIVTKKFGSTVWYEVISPEFERKEFISNMHCGPFRAWKKEIHKKVGYFDEQLRSGADFDLMIRIATFFDMKKTHWLLGYYLNANTWLSTGGQKSFFSLQAKELRIINTRYNVLSKIDFSVPIEWYDIGAIKNNDSFKKIEDYGFSSMRRMTFLENVCSLYFTVKYLMLRIIKYTFLTLKWK